MRYLDWDVLLFPSGEHVEDVNCPFREFKVQAQAERKGGDPTANLTPLVTAFVPSLQQDASFQISVHSWSRTEAFFTVGPDGRPARELWEVRVVVDGNLLSVTHLPVDAQWPQIVKTATHDHGQELAAHTPLRFPPFHDALRNERSWLACDELGRIRVELSAGWREEQASSYVKMNDVVTFAFQHAPMGMLQMAGIAWPSEEMWNHPVPRQTLPPQAGHSMQAHHPHHQVPHMAHRKMPSVSNPQLPVMSAAQPFAKHISPYSTHVAAFDPSSRSTSAYSTMSASAGPLLPNNYNMQASQQTGAQANAPREAPYQFRLPSDQIAQIIRALGPQKQEQGQEADQSMPPPPLPLHATQGKEESTFAPIGHNAPQGVRTQRPDFDQQALNAIDRRAASNSGYSDISMHATCNAFPHCITEDPNGCLVHDSMAVPVEVVKGKKEGSSPDKPRDFRSVTLDAAAPSVSQRQTSQSQSPMTVAPKETMTMRSPEKAGMLPSSLVSSSPADATGKKRTRAALKALNINDGGSPQKAETANKPVRKASRASMSSNKSDANDKENLSDHFITRRPEEGLETQEMLDA